MPTDKRPPVVTLAFQLEAPPEVAKHLADDFYAALRDNGIGVPYRQCSPGRYMLTPEPD
jgi:hypothetical protein